MPKFDLEGFTSNFKGGARQHLFYYTPLFPGGVGADQTGEHVTYLVRSTSIPATTIEEIPVPWQGYELKIGGRQTFEDFVITFNCDKDALIRQTFEDWCNLIHDPATNLRTPIDLHIADQQLTLLGLDLQPILEVILLGAWCKSVAAATLEYATNDIVQFEVTFGYQYHQVIKV